MNSLINAVIDTIVFSSELVVQELPQDFWKLREDLQVLVNECSITIPAGFVTDFCSVPKVPVIYEALGDKWRKAGVLHDWLYSFGDVPREVADMILREAIISLGGSTLEAAAVYSAVRLFGAQFYQGKTYVNKEATTPSEPKSNTFPYLT
jgi:hypothetical protein